MAGPFQYKDEIFFKEILTDGTSGKRKHYAIGIEFHERGSPHVRSIKWIFNAPNIENKDAYKVFIEKTINTPYETI